MKSLDAICAKLKKQTSDSPPQDEQLSDHSKPCSPALDKGRNKRKNFKPKLCRLSDANQNAVPIPEPIDASSEPASVDQTSPVASPTSGSDQQGDDTGSLQDFPVGMENPGLFMLDPQHANEFGASEDSSILFSDPSQMERQKTPISAATAISMANPSLEHYMVRFTGSECGFEQCRLAVGCREHFHCKQCDWRLFTKKEEMLRHYKWHRKREESLAHGFMRYSASDSCTNYFDKCPHNLRQTHYHCLQKDCDKVYISTSDVQMHANSHRKAAHIAREGFQRFKASEDCKYPDCPFREPKHRTTHFHCLRAGCTHSFKNKSDMDKHKAHHLRDEQLIRDGFKKFMKSELCSFVGCAFSRVVNHIHCIRPGCDYVLHSTGQMYSHKRKHEKQEKRCADMLMGAGVKPILPQMPVQFNPLLNPATLAAAVMQAQVNAQQAANGNAHHAIEKPKPPSPTRVAVPSSDGLKIKIKQYDPAGQNFVHTSTIFPNDHQPQKPSLNDDVSASIDMKMLQQPLNLMQSIEEDDRPIQTANAKNAADSWKKYMTRFTANDRCLAHCALMYKDHYHCTAGEGCTMTFRSKEGVREHAKQHQLLDQAADTYKTVNEDQHCPVGGCLYNKKERHFHCAVENCSEVISSSEPIFRRLEHFKVHEYSSQMPPGSLPSIFTGSPNSSGGSTSSQSEVRRKRGRPPKYQGLDMNVTPGGQIGVGNDILLTSFKLSRPTAPAQPTRRGRPRTVSSPRHPGPLSPPLVAPPNMAANLNNMLAAFPNVSRTGLPEPQLKPEFEGFVTYMPSEVCPDEACHHQNQLHYHCRATRCYYATIQSDQLESHRTDFHENLEIPEGFACFDRNYNCKFTNCTNNENARHFHCMRGGCGQSFLKVNNLAQHETEEHGTVQDKNANVTDDRTVKTSGIYFPSNTDTVESAKLAPRVPYTVDQHCGRPFCKLKRRVHYHCGTCSQGFSNVGRLLPHLQKHGITLQPQEAAAALIGSFPATSVAAPTSSPSVPSPSVESDDLGEAQRGRKIKFHMFQPELLKFTTDGRKLFSSAPQISQAVPLDLGPPAKKFKFVDCTQETVDAVNRSEQESANTPESIPPGFGSFGQMDCGVRGCTYSMHPVHYHCLRPGCTYAIWDKTKLAEHSQTHQNPNDNSKNGHPICTDPRCPLWARGPHLHCPKCQFWAVDTTKMAIHTKQHAKQDQMAALGFEKVAPNVDQLCRYDGCPFTAQTHYHCVQCTHIALNQLQMSMHKNSSHPTTCD